MSETGDKLIRLYRELRRRKTIRVASGYILLGWVLIEVASVVLEAFETPNWVLRALIVTVVAGLPVAVVLSWVFDITPDGLKRTDELDAMAANGEGRAAEQSDEDDTSVDALKPSVAVPLGSAQRRQVSLVRCTFELSEGGDAVRDPEVLRAAMPDLERLIERVAGRFSGYRLAGGGPTYEILFGYPTAYENDAVRAVAAAFAAVRDAKQLRPDARGHSRLAVNPTIGVHSDLVVVEESVDESTAARVVGNTSATAGWLQTLASPGTITLSSDTWKLLGTNVRCESLGEHANAQTGESQTVYRAEEVRSHEDVLEAYAGISQRIYGRDSEIALIMDRWELAQDGEDQFIVLRGEAGIGKSTLIRSIVAKASQTEAALVLPLYCSPFEMSNAFHPVVEFMFGSGLGLESADSDSQRAERVARLLTASGLDVDRAAPLLATLLKFGNALSGDAEHVPTGAALRNEMLNCLVELFHSAAARGRLLLIVEDLHWADPSTLEFIDMIVNSGSESGALCLFTTRPDMTLDWESRSDVTTLDLQRLPRRVTEVLIRDILGDVKLPDEVVEQILKETGGNPLFAEELTKAIAESAADAPGDTSTGLVLPGTLQQSLASRIDRLGSAKPLLQLASLLGRRFDYELLKAVSQTENEQALQTDLRSIVNAGFLFQEGAVPDSSYRFKHILMQESTQNTLLKSTRVDLHLHIATILEQQFEERADRQPELLAYHFSQADRPEQAVRYWTLASRRSLESFAILEAIEQAENGLAALQALPESALRDTAEITLCSLRGKGLLTLRGYADPMVEETFARALKLSESIGQSPELFQIIVGLWMYFFIGGEAEHALALSRRLKRIAEAQASAAKSLQAHYCHGYSLYRLGRYAESRDELEQALADETADADFTAESASGDDTRIHVRCVLAHVLWHLGHVRRSLELLKEARTLAVSLGNPYGIVFARFLSCWLHVLRREPEAAAEHARATIELSVEHGYRFFLPLAKLMQAWASHDGGAQATASDAAARIDTMAACLNTFREAGATNGETALMLELAEERLRIGDSAAAVSDIERAEARMDETGERFYQPDVLRLKGLAAKRRGDLSRAEELLGSAAAAARLAGSISLALRATTNLAEMLSERGQTDKARELLTSANAIMPEQDAGASMAALHGR